MGKIHNSKDLQKQRLSRSLLAISLAASLAAFGCTTNLNPGNGTPTRSGPELRSAPTSGVTSGSESVTPPPMTSSYNSAEVLPRVQPRSIRRSAAEAAAIMAGRQSVRGRYLGPANPGPGNRPYQSDFAGGFVNPAMLTNPQATINSTISSPPTPAISSGAGGFAGDGVGVQVGGVTATGANAGATVAGTTTSAATGVAGTDVGTTGVGVGLPAGTFAAGARPAVTESISNNPGVTAASAGFGRTGAGVVRGGVATSGTAATAPTVGTTGTAATTTATSANATATGATGAVRILRGTNGGVTITNTNSTTTNRSTGTRSQ